MDNISVKQVITEIGDLLELHCKDCTQIAGLTSGQITEYCSQCEIGKKLLQLGTCLGAFKSDAPKRQPLKETRLSKEQYLMYKSTGYVDKEICKLLKLGTNTLYTLKAKWGIKEKRGPKKKCKNVG